MANGCEVAAQEALRVGWDVLCHAMRSWGFRSLENLSESMHRQFRRPRWGAHFSAWAKKRILNATTRRVVGNVQSARTRQSACCDWDCIDGSPVDCTDETQRCVRGIATSCTVRRLVAKALAKKFMKVFEAECAPFQYALSTRAGTDCVGHLLRAATGAKRNLTILTVDGTGANDNVLRSTMLGRLAAMPAARSLWPYGTLNSGVTSSSMTVAKHVR